MLNSEKVILMTRLAMYEQNEGKKTIPVSRYFKGDYVGIQLIKSFFAVTIAYILGIILFIAYKASFLIENLMDVDLFLYGKAALVIYVALLFVYMMATFIMATYKFKVVRKSLKTYNGQLKNLLKLQSMEVISPEERELGGTVEDDGTFGF